MTRLTEFAHSVQSKTILVVEDNPDDVFALKNAFRKAGLTNPLAVVEDGEQAIAYLSGQSPYADAEKYPPPAIVLLDLRLPRIPGLDVLTWLRGKSRAEIQPPSKARSIPVVVLTHSEELTNIRRAYELGANSYLIKPLAPQAVSQLITPLLIYQDRPMRLLLADDTPADRELALEMLRREFVNLQVTEVEIPQQLDEALKAEEFDLVITDFQMHWINGIQLLRRVKSRWPDCPVVMFTGSTGQDMVMEALRAGLDNYVLKNPHQRDNLPDVARAALMRARERHALVESEARYHLLVEQIPAVAYTAEPNKERKLVFISPQIEALTGYPPEDWLADHLWESCLHPQDKKRVLSEFRDAYSRAEIFRSEYRLRVRAGGEIWVKDEAHWLKDSDGQVVAAQGIMEDVTERKTIYENLLQTHAALEIHQIELTTQNEELIRAHQELEASREKYLSLYDYAPVGYLTLDENGLILNANLTAADLLGVERGALVKNLLPRFIATEDQDIFYLHRQKLFETGAPQADELRMQRKDGVLLWAQIESTLTRDGEAAPIFRVILSDISERKEAEEKLHESEARLELFFAQSLDGFFFMMLDEPIRWDDTVDKDQALDYVFAHQRITKANDAILAQYGATREQYLGQTPNTFFAHDLPQGKRVWREFFDKGNLHVDTDERKTDGTPIWIEGDYICLYDSEGRITGHFGIQRDITERKEAEEEIRQRNEDLALLNAINAAVNRGESLSAIVSLISGQVKTILGSFGATLHLLNAERSRLVMQNMALPAGILADLQKLLGVAIPAIEHDLKKDHPFRRAIESKRAQLVTDPQQVRKNYEGYVDAAPLSEKARLRIKKLIPAAIKMIGTKSQMIAPLISGDTLIGTLDIGSSDLFTEGDLRRFEAIAGQLTAIIQRKQAEEQIRYQADLLANVSDAIVATDMQYNILHWNAAAEIQYGWTASEVMGRPMHDFIQNGYARDALEAILQKVFQDGHWNGEVTLNRRDGTRFPVLSALSLVKDGQGAPIGFVAANRDITERKQAEERIAQLSRAVEQSADTIFITDRQGVIEYVNPAFEQVTGFSKAEALGFTPRILKSELIDPQYYASMWATILSGRVMRAEVLNKRKNGEVFYYDQTITPLKNAEGVVTHFVSTGKDITERRQADAEMRHRLKELEAINHISTALRVAQTLDEMLPRLLDETLSVLEANSGILLLYDAGRDQVRKAAARGWFTVLPNEPWSAREGMVGQALAINGAYHTREFHSDPNLHESIQKHVPSGWGGVCVPIHAAQEIVGFLFISVQLPRELMPEEVNLLTTLTEIAGNAIQRTRLHEQTLLHVERLTALHTIDATVASSLDLRVTFNVLLSQTIAQLGADAVAVLLLNPQTQQLEYAAGHGFRGREIIRLSVKMGQDYAGQAALERKPIHVPDLAQAPFGNAKLTADEGFVAYFGIPLIAKGQVKGVLELFFRAPFTPDPEWTEFMDTIAGQTAIAMDNAKLFEESQRLITDLALAYDATIDGWSKALDLRDQETEGHSQRVTTLTLKLARQMNIPQPDLIHIQRGGLLHDIGKMGVPDNILLKPGKLTDEEWNIMRQHPQHAFDMLSPIAYLKPALDIPYCHHEKWDGSGYPRGLRGEQIPLAARLFAIVDVYDALTSKRPYRAAWSKEKTLEHIRNGSGKHFDPAVVEAFLRLQL